jgi:hypothetical protein
LQEDYLIIGCCLERWSVKCILGILVKRFGIFGKAVQTVVDFAEA